MTKVVEVKDLTKRFGNTVALDEVSFNLEPNTIYGLLGRNGAGKTTLMSIITAQAFASSGKVQVFGEEPYENAGVLRRMCFMRDNQVYPDSSKPVHAFRIARLCFPNWNQALAERLVADFRLPVATPIKKLSRGQLSAVGAIIGLAARAEVTFFDEPYLGFDAAAREIFYDRLLEDYAEHPRTIVLSSHLIDEIANILERVIVLDNGRVILNDATDDLRDRAVVIRGDNTKVAAFTAGRAVIHRQALGALSAVTVLGHLTHQDRAALTANDLDVSPVTLQQLVVRATQAAAGTAADQGAAR
ncbi:MAG TPA: ABC transporter ATP-binding protein [Trueperaceae bacterium]|nr:ABC transporter ATP-binding protein [Trueperaceae bacterium]